MAKFNLNDYVTVQERINKFWTENPDGAIKTEIVSVTPDHKSIVIIANVYKSHDLITIPNATGIAQEHAGTHAMVNSTSWVEAAETSAIGRALANMGYAISNADRPSREEMEKKERYESSPARPPVPDSGKPAPDAEPAKPGPVDLNAIDPNAVGRAGVPFAQLREDLHLDKPINAQVQQWKADVALENDPELPPEAVRDACKVLALLAYDAVKIDVGQAWRFAELAKGCLYVEAVDGLEKVAEQAGALTSFVIAAIAGRRRQLAAQAQA